MKGNREKRISNIFYVLPMSQTLLETLHFDYVLSKRSPHIADCIVKETETQKRSHLFTVKLVTKLISDRLRF